MREPRGKPLSRQCRDRAEMSGIFLAFYPNAGLCRRRRSRLVHNKQIGGRLMALVPSPQWLDTGNNAWQLAAATFVGLQSIPGLTVLYGGIVKKKWAINSAFMAIYAFASVLVVWILFDYNMAFGPQLFPFLGTPGLATSAAFTTGQASVPAAAAGSLHPRPAKRPGARRRHAGADLPDGDADLLPVRVRRHHRYHPRRFGARPHELHRVDDLLPGVDDAGLYGRRVQPVGWRLARRHGGRGFLGRLCH